MAARIISQANTRTARQPNIFLFSKTIRKKNTRRRSDRSRKPDAPPFADQSRAIVAAPARMNGRALFVNEFYQREELRRDVFVLRSPFKIEVHKLHALFLVFLNHSALGGIRIIVEITAVATT